MRLPIVVAFAICAAATPAAVRSDDVFTTLQRNAWYLRTEDPAVRIYVTEIGQGPPVVFLHGGPGNDFNYIVDALRRQLATHRFVLFDQRGSLLSPVAQDEIKALSLAILVEDLERVRLALGERQLVLFGHSFGTVLAEAYFAKYPQNVRCMVLAASIPPSGRLSDELAAVRARMKLLRERAVVDTILAQEHLDRDPAALTDRERSFRQRVSNAAVDIVHLDRWREVEGGGVYYNGAVDDAIGASLPDDIGFMAAYAEHPIPVTVIDGDQDFLDPSGASWTSAALAGVTVRVLPSAGHYGWIDAPAEFAQALREGLSR